MDDSTVLTVISLLVGLVATVWVGWFFGRRSRRRPVLSVALACDKLLVPNHELRQDGLVVTLDGRRVEQITRTRLAIWNSGGGPVRCSDVVAADPVRIQFEAGDEPLQVRVLSFSSEQNQLALELQSTHMSIDFEYLDERDGGIVEVLHQGARPTVCGSIVGADIQTRSREVDLSASAVGWMKHARRSERLRSRLRWPGLVAFMVPIAIAAFWLIAVVRSDDDGPSVLNVAEYDLTTYEGQVEFADDVDTSDDPSPWAPTLFGGVWLLLVVPDVLRGRAAIPHSIVAGGPGT